MSKVDPVTYAEATLGVHAAHDAAIHDHVVHGQTVETINRLNTEIRARKALIEDRELEIISDERAKEHGLSKTAFGDHLKEVLREDEELRRHRGILSDLEADRGANELRLKHLALGVQLGSARLQELGGLLSFYAACKLASATPPAGQS